MRERERSPQAAPWEGCRGRACRLACTAALRALVVAAAAGATALPARALAADRAVLFLFDTSGSIRASDLEGAKRLVREFAASAGPDDVFGLLSFDDRPAVRAPLGHDAAGLERALDQLAIGGRYTALHDALYDAAQILGAAGAARRGIVLFTDGKDENSALLFEDAEAALRKNRIAVYAVGVGPRTDERFMRRLAKLSEGEYFPAEALGDTEALLARIAGALQAVPAAPGATPAEGAGAAPSAASGAPGGTPPAEGAPPPPGATAAAAGSPGAPPAGTPAPTLPAATATPHETAPPAGEARRRRPSEPIAPPAAASGEERKKVYLVVGALLFLLSAATLLVLFRSSRREAATPGPRAPASPLEIDASVVPAPPASAQAGAAPGARARAAEPPRAPEEESTPAMDALGGTVSLPESPYAEEGFGGDVLDRTFMLDEKPVLFVRTGRNAGESFLLGRSGEVTIGRARENDVVVNDHSVSKRHVMIRCEGQVFTILDLGSTNGSFLNDRRLEGAVFLKPGDVVRVGETELVFRFEQRRR